MAHRDGVEDSTEGEDAQARTEEDDDEVERGLGEGVDVGDNPLIWVVDVVAGFSARCRRRGPVISRQSKICLFVAHIESH